MFIKYLFLLFSIALCASDHSRTNDTLSEVSSNICLDSYGHTKGFRSKNYRLPSWHTPSDLIQRLNTVNNYVGRRLPIGGCKVLVNELSHALALEDIQKRTLAVIALMGAIVRFIRAGQWRHEGTLDRDESWQHHEVVSLLWNCLSLSDVPFFGIKIDYNCRSRFALILKTNQVLQKLFTPQEQQAIDFMLAMRELKVAQETPTLSQGVWYSVLQDVCCPDDALLDDIAVPMINRAPTSAVDLLFTYVNVRPSLLPAIYTRIGNSAQVLLIARALTQYQRNDFNANIKDTSDWRITKQAITNLVTSGWFTPSNIRQLKNAHGSPALKDLLESLDLDKNIMKPIVDLCWLAAWSYESLSEQD